MNKPPLTLNNIRKSEKITPRNVGVAQFLSKDDLAELKRNNLARKQKKQAKRKFDDVDAYIAEIIARFGYDTYRAWRNDEIDDPKMNRLLLAERARERQQWLPLEALLRALIQGGVPTLMIKKPGKVIKQAQKILQDEVKTAKGEM